MITLLDRSLYVGQMMYNLSETIGISGRTAESFDEVFLEYSGGVWTIGSAFRIITYDSVWHAALGLNMTLEALKQSGRAF
jgi:gamma-aminobutyric acid type B receptor